MDIFLSKISKFKISHIINKYIKNIKNIKKIKNIKNVKKYINTINTNKILTKNKNLTNDISLNDISFCINNNSNNYSIKYCNNNPKKLYIRFIFEDNYDTPLLYNIYINSYVNSNHVTKIIFTNISIKDTGYIFLEFDKNDFIFIESNNHLPKFLLKYTDNLSYIINNEDFNTNITYFI